MSDEPEPQLVRVRPTLKQRLSAQFSEYGKLALYTYLTLSILAIIGFSIAIGLGVHPSSATSFLGVIAAGWVAAKATLPIRILITLGLTPLVAYVVRRRWPKQDDDDDETDAADEDNPAPAGDDRADVDSDAAATPGAANSVTDTAATRNEPADR